MVAKLVREGVHGGHGYFGELLCTDEGDNMKVDVLFVPAGSMSAAGDIMADLIDFLDSREEDPDLEPTCGVSYGQPPGADESDWTEHARGLGKAVGRAYKKWSSD